MGLPDIMFRAFHILKSSITFGVAFVPSSLCLNQETFVKLRLFLI